MKELVDAGIEPVVFLTSDTGPWKDKSLGSIGGGGDSHLERVFEVR